MWAEKKLFPQEQMCHWKNEAREKTSWGKRWAQGGSGAEEKTFFEEKCVLEDRGDGVKEKAFLREKVG
jgi:hypothetical protein